MKAQADKKRREVTLEVGEKAYLKLQPYRQKSVAHRPFPKLASQFYGPFAVLQRVGAVAYKLELPAGAKIHPVFHVSQLRKVVGQQTVQPKLPPQLTATFELQLQPEAVQGVRTIDTDHGQKLEVLIKWKDNPEFDST
ncbi:hypothetical protein LXL04_008762 [Taraxacum kok-saghyz]